MLGTSASSVTPQRLCLPFAPALAPTEGSEAHEVPRTPRAHKGSALAGAMADCAWRTCSQLSVPKLALRGAEKSVPEGQPPSYQATGPTGFCPCQGQTTSLPHTCPEWSLRWSAPVSAPCSPVPDRIQGGSLSGIDSQAMGLGLRRIPREASAHCK